MRIRPDRLLPEQRADCRSQRQLRFRQFLPEVGPCRSAGADSGRYDIVVNGVDDFIQTIEPLSSGRIDATLNAEVSYYDYMAQHPEANIKIACIDPASTQVAIPMRKGEESATLAAAINEALAGMAEDGTLTGLSIKYFGTDISREQ